MEAACAGGAHVVRSKAAGKLTLKWKLQHGLTSLFIGDPIRIEDDTAAQALYKQYLATERRLAIINSFNVGWRTDLDDADLVVLICLAIFDMLIRHAGDRLDSALRHLEGSYALISLRA